MKGQRQRILSSLVDSKGVRGQLGSEDFIQMAMGTIWDSRRGLVPQDRSLKK